MDSYLRPSRISNVTQTYSDSSKRILRTKAGKTNSPRISRLLFTAITDNGPRSNVHLFKIMGHFEASSVAPTAGPTAWLG